ncbi:MAG: hypothetical protein ACI9MR_002848 [Myxococcota bacterium]|jgi:hypothetical protein
MASSPIGLTGIRLGAVVGTTVFAMCALAGCDTETATTAAPASASYLVANGSWMLDSDEQSYSDPRNPKLMVLSTTEEPGSPSLFSFYADPEGTMPIAESCAFQYNRSQTDSVRFPAYKTAIWVVFELESGQQAACDAFQKVGFAPTTSDDGRLHLRFGEIDYDALVGPQFSAPESPELWWSVYRAVDGPRDIPAFPYVVANGEQLMDPASPETQSDIRNPSRVVMMTTADANSESRFIFYEHQFPDQIWADCNFQVRYTMPDPAAFPASKTALWDAYEMTGANVGACQDFANVVMFWPAGGRPMSLRYGTIGFGGLLSISLESETSAASWWASYCPPQGCQADR